MMAGVVEIRWDGDPELRSAIGVYLIGERPEGATIGDLARLKLGGRTPAEEVDCVSRAVSQLVQAGEVNDGRGESCLRLAASTWRDCTRALYSLLSSIPLHLKALVGCKV